MKRAAMRAQDASVRQLLDDLAVRLLAVSVLRSRHCSCREGLQDLSPESMSRASHSYLMAGFEVTTNGRIWVTTEN